MIAHVHREDFSFRVPIIQIELFQRLAPTVLNVSKVFKAAHTNCQTNFKAQKRSTIFVIAKSLLLNLVHLMWMGTRLRVCRRLYKGKQHLWLPAFLYGQLRPAKRGLILLWVRIEEKIVYQSWHHFRREESKKTRATHTMEKYNFLEPIIHSQMIYSLILQDFEAE